MTAVSAAVDSDRGSDSAVAEAEEEFDESLNDPLVCESQEDAKNGGMQALCAAVHYSSAVSYVTNDVVL